MKQQKSSWVYQIGYICYYIRWGAIIFAMLWLGIRALCADTKKEMIPPILDPHIPTKEDISHHVKEQEQKNLPEYLKEDKSNGSKMACHEQHMDVEGAIRHHSLEKTH